MFQIDILVNNAGRSQRSLAIDCSTDVDHQMMELNFHSQLSLTKLVLPHMIRRKTGQLVVTSSVAGKIGKENLSQFTDCCSMFVFVTHEGVSMPK